jgi:hypothetical protein
MSFALVFFVSVANLIKLQVPFLFGSDAGPRKRAWKKDYTVLMGPLEEATAQMFKKMEEIT